MDESAAKLITDNEKPNYAVKIKQETDLSADKVGQTPNAQTIKSIIPGNRKRVLKVADPNQRSSLHLVPRPFVTNIDTKKPSMEALESLISPKETSSVEARPQVGEFKKLTVKD